MKDRKWQWYGHRTIHASGELTIEELSDATGEQGMNFVGSGANQNAGVSTKRRNAGFLNRQEVGTTG
jgi:hypothetical protein